MVSYPRIYLPHGSLYGESPSEWNSWTFTGNGDEFQKFANAPARPRPRRPRYLSEAAAWRSIARRIMGRWPIQDSLCGCVGSLRMGGRIDLATERKMGRRVRQFQAADFQCNATRWQLFKAEYLNGTDVFTDSLDTPARALAALWLACEAEAES